MGPPSEKGGIFSDRLNKVLAQARLQWGRPPRRAESSLVSGENRPLEGLQWGRPPRRAESLTQQNELLVAAMASMGPPSEKGGIFHGACGHRRGAFDASMGPPSEKGGI